MIAVFLPLKIEIGMEFYYQNKIEKINVIEPNIITVNLTFSYQDFIDCVMRGQIIFIHRKKYKVFYDERPAICVNLPSSEFDNYSDALKHARMIMGSQFGGSEDGLTGFHLGVNYPLKIYPHTIEIRKV